MLLLLRALRFLLLTTRVFLREERERLLCLCIGLELERLVASGVRLRESCVHNKHI